MQKSFCDGCGRELQVGIPLVSIRASVTPFTPGHTAEEMEIITTNYNREYHADCWSEREPDFIAAVTEADRFFLAGQTDADYGSEDKASPPVAESPSEPPAPAQDGTGEAEKSDTETAPESDKESGDETPVEAAQLQSVEPPELPPSEHELTAESRGIKEPTTPPGTNP